LIVKTPDKVRPANVSRARLFPISTFRDRVPMKKAPFEYFCGAFVVIATVLASDKITIAGEVRQSNFRRFFRLGAHNPLYQFILLHRKREDFFTRETPMVASVTKFTRSLFIPCAVWLLSGGTLLAELKTQTISYTHDGATLKGYLAFDESASGKRPGILVVHEWWGLNDYAKMRADQLAKLGFVAFCPDMYGDGKTTEHPKEAGQMATMIRKNVKGWQGRAQAGLEILKKQPQVDSTKLAAIGYCFGGSTALQLAYTGADLAAVVTFHAGLPTPTADEAKAIKAKVLVCNGADDTFVGADSIKSFKSSLETAKVSLTFISHPGTKHSFTVKGIESKGVDGLAYNEAADKESFEAMLKLFKDALGK
jgi:dienelactone hydrolase